MQVYDLVIKMRTERDGGLGQVLVDELGNDVRVRLG